MKAELQTKARRLTLLDLSPAPLPVFVAAENKDFVVQQAQQPHALSLAATSPTMLDPPAAPRNVHSQH